MLLTKKEWENYRETAHIDSSISFIRHILNNKLYVNMTTSEMEALAGEFFKDEPDDKIKAIFLFLAFAKLPIQLPYEATEGLLSLKTYEGGALTQEEVNQYIQEQG